MAIIVAALLFCPVFAFADETTAAPDGTYDPVTTSVTSLTDFSTSNIRCNSTCEIINTSDIDSLYAYQNTNNTTGNIDWLNIEYNSGYLYGIYDFTATVPITIDISNIPVDTYADGHIRYAFAYNIKFSFATNTQPINKLGSMVYDYEITSNNGSIGYSAKVNGQSSSAVNVTFFVSGEIPSNIITPVVTIVFRFKSVTNYYCGDDGGNSAYYTMFLSNNYSANLDVQSFSNKKVLAVQGSEISYLDHIDAKLYDIWETADLSYHELYEMHTRLISMHTTLSQVLQTLSTFASQTHSDITTVWSQIVLFQQSNHADLVAILDAIRNNVSQDTVIYDLLRETFKQNSSSLATEFDEAISVHESHEEIAVSAIESAAPVVDSQIDALNDIDTSSFWESNRQAANFWKLVLNKFFDNAVLGALATFLIIVNIILLIKFVLRL